jgi:uncharacterized damage-inducible protein DinB
MTNSIAPAAAAGPFQAYVANLFAVLGTREPLEVMRGTPAALRHTVSGLSLEQLSRAEAPGKWSVRQVVQHLADAELVGGFRFRMVLAQDAPMLPGYDQETWAERLKYEESDWEAALEDFAALRGANLRLLERATPAEFERVMVHSERGNESLRYMVRMYAGHDLVHLRQIARIRQAAGAMQ